MSSLPAAPLAVGDGAAPALARWPLSSVEAALAGPGLWLDVGAATLRVQGVAVPALAPQLQRVYGAFDARAHGDWADVHVRLRPAPGLRRWIRPQVVLHCDGEMPFDPFPADHPLPLFEWGCNWMIGHRLNDLLLLHAGALARDGLALVMPAMPGSGKSTLTAALAHRGWRLLSDEFGAFDPRSGQFQAVLKPIGLKNQSIDVIRRFAPQAVLGPSFPATRKGTVAHVAPPADAVAGRRQGATPGAVVLPRWVAGSPTRLEPLPPHELFSSLAFNAFNYVVLGEVGFRAVLAIVQRSVGFSLRYSDLDDAVATLERAWPDVLAHVTAQTGASPTQALGEGMVSGAEAAGQAGSTPLSP